MIDRPTMDDRSMASQRDTERQRGVKTFQLFLKRQNSIQGWR
jgi:hypothetical protein